MLTLQETYCTLIWELERIFLKCVWRHVQVLPIGAILALGQREHSAPGLSALCPATPLSSSPDIVNPGQASSWDARLPSGDSVSHDER
jgi:hypothetical protein